MKTARGVEAEVCVGAEVDGKKGFSTGGITGFGLFLSKKTINVYGWEIQEVGEKSKGAKFTITIPRTNESGKENFQVARLIP